MKGKSIKFLLSALLVLLLTFGTAFAATEVTLTISGTIAATASISIDNATTDLGTLTNDAVVDSLKATVTETSNSATGYTVTLATTNGTTTGLLKNGTSTISYTVKYNDSAVSFVAGSATVTDVSDSSGSPATKTVKISYDIVDVAALPSGVYTDTLTFTIATQ